MKKNLFWIILLSVSLGASSAFAAGGSYVGNGGNSVVCFSIPLSQAMSGRLMTPLGKSHIQSAVVLEFYLASLKQTIAPSRFFQALSQGDEQSAIHYLEESISTVPKFLTQVSDAEATLGSIANGIAAPDGLVPVDDAALAIQLPSDCALVQTVIQKDSVFYYDPVVWGALTQQGYLQKFILQLHEDIYSVAAGLGQTSSADTQLLLVSLMTDFPARYSLLEKLYALHFGDYLTHDEINGARNDARAFIEKALGVATDRSRLSEVLSDYVVFRVTSIILPTLWASLVEPPATSGDGEICEFEDCMRSLIAAIYVNEAGHLPPGSGQKIFRCA